jgi:hypothetical protein
MRFRRARPVQEREPHPDPLVESQLLRIISLRAAVARQELVAAELIRHLAAAREQQDRASRSLRGSHSKLANSEFELTMKAQRDRIQDALAGITAAEDFIAARNTEIAELTASLTAVELSYLRPAPARGS